LKYLEKDESLGLGFIRKSVLDGLFEGSVLVKAELEAKAYK